MTKLVTVLNQKGGVGKTTLSCHLAFSALEAGKTVLLVDMDTQGNASQFMSQDMTISKRLSNGAEQLFIADEFVYTDTPHASLKLLHGHKDLEVLDQNAGEVLEHAPTLREKMRSLPFDYVIFDTPTSIGPRSTSPLYWSDLAIVAIRPQLTSFVGLDDTLETVKHIRRSNPVLKTKYVINQMSSTSKTQRVACEALIEKFGKEVLAKFSMRQHVADALDSFVPVWKYPEAKSPLKKEWRSFAETVLNLNA